MQNLNTGLDFRAGITNLHDYGHIQLQLKMTLSALPHGIPLFGQGKSELRLDSNW